MVTLPKFGIINFQNKFFCYLIFFSHFSLLFFVSDTPDPVGNGGTSDTGETFDKLLGPELRESILKLIKVQISIFTNFCTLQTKVSVLNSVKEKLYRFSILYYHYFRKRLLRKQSEFEKWCNLCMLLPVLSTVVKRSRLRNLRNI